MTRRCRFILPIFLCSVGSFFFLVYVQVCTDSRCYGSRSLPATLSRTLDLPRASQPCLSGAQLAYDKFCVLECWRTGERVLSSADSATVTLSTQGTAEYLYHVITVCDRWQGPISVAVYLDGQEEFSQAAKAIDSLRDCHPCVARWISWHLFYDVAAPLTRIDDGPSVTDCASPAYRITRPDGWQRNGSYPINVARNIARNRTSTPYIFASDIELYPSEHIIQRFGEMMRSRKPAAKREVFVLPVFEVYPHFQAPSTKERLRYMYHRKQAISFHMYRCNICHRIPHLPKWMNLTLSSRKEDSNSSIQPFHVWATVKRSSRYGLKYWEPFFIGTPQDPEFDPRLSWEGKQNKMQLAYELCMMDYSFHILDEAFLVHSPGVNIYSSAKERFRVPFAAQNLKVMKSIVKELRKKYGTKNKCG